MNLIQKLTNLEIPNLEIIYITDSGFEHQFELRTKKSGIIAIGWILYGSNEEDHIELNNEFHKISVENYEYTKGDNLDLMKWDGFLFGINSKSIWSCPRQVFRLSGKKHDSFELFLSQFKGKFN
jgi:hypothetical protein